MQPTKEQIEAELAKLGKPAAYKGWTIREEEPFLNAATQTLVCYLHCHCMGSGKKPPPDKTHGQASYAPFSIESIPEQREAALCGLREMIDQAELEMQPVEAY